MVEEHFTQLLTQALDAAVSRADGAPRAGAEEAVLDSVSFARVLGRPLRLGPVPQHVPPEGQLVHTLAPLGEVEVFALVGGARVGKIRLGDHTNGTGAAAVVGLGLLKNELVRELVVGGHDG